MHDGELRSYLRRPVSSTIIPNQGRGAAINRIEAAQRIFPAAWINEAACQAGLDALELGITKNGTKGAAWGWGRAWWGSARR